ncbi:MAG: DUF1349 domain-containing protein [Chloroflexi bacterium]|nr:DUF1349 domain-containing protein [Chloroflexota bacterium]
MKWYNEPPVWKAEGSKITATSAPKTDYWRITHDGGKRDSGHFYFEDVTGDFVADVKFSGEYRDLYDQAGLMVRLDETVWMKCGIEFFEGLQHVSAVVTREFSDWSVVPLPNPPAVLWLRVSRHGATFEVRYSFDGAAYPLLRSTTLTAEPTIGVGIMLCSPTGNGLSAAFEGLTIRKA